ncbi:hypothetical protein XHC_3491 [Xanthomonas hortorum pv. carotae str. M081]|nr:hypothetical protein XHC_3491 [Xanthomonas hortorum pv. carotae str. M081]
MHREQHILHLGIGDLGIDEAGQCALAQHGGIDDFASLDRHFFLQHGGGAIVADEFDLQRARRCHRGGLLAAEEVAIVHVRDMRPGVAAPLAHAVRMLACVILHRQRCAAIGVAFAQHRVDRAALDLVVARLDVFFGVVLGRVRIRRQRITLALQFGDRGLELRHRGADVGQLDDVGFRRGGQRAQLTEVVGDLLRVGQVLGEQRQNAAGQRDIAGFDHDAGGIGVGIDDRQQRLRGQIRCFVGERVEDLRCLRHEVRWLLWSGGAPVSMAMALACATGVAGGTPIGQRVERGDGSARHCRV